MTMVHKAALRRWGLAFAAVLVCAGTLGYWGFRILGTPKPQRLRLLDGTEIFFLSNTTVEPAPSYPRVREIKIDGEAFVRATAMPQALLIRSRLLLLTVTGATGLRVTARSNETGEAAEVLYGQVEATKAYPSQQQDRDALLAGDEVMVNQTIDLQEKETTDVARLRAWSDALIEAASRSRGSSQRE